MPIMWTGVRKLVQVNFPKFKHVHHFCVAAQEVTVDKATLSKLRKKTGFQLIKCKNALAQFNNDIKQAEKWMREQAQKEGWAKAGKLAERAMSQGLVGLIEDENRATIVEVNCETDFVGKTEQFQLLVKQVAQTCHAHFCEKNELKMLMGTEASELQNTEQDKSLGDLVALLVGNLGENMLLRRAAFVQKEPSTILKTYVHDSGPRLVLDNCQFGKFAAIVKIELPDTDAIASDICQHIVGMNPKSIGQWEVPKDDKGKQKKKRSEGDGKNVADKGEEETLLKQEFLLDPKMTVKQYLQDSGPRVVDFVRLQCGEELGDED